jgi:hypothetical protein
MRAMSLRSAGESFPALALPPFNPPNLPSVTAAWFFSLGFVGGAWPVAC